MQDQPRFSVPFQTNPPPQFRRFRQRRTRSSDPRLGISHGSSTTSDPPGRHGTSAWRVAGVGVAWLLPRRGGVGWIVDCRAAIVSLCSTPPEQFILHEDVSRPCIEISTWGCAPKARSFRFSGTHLLERDRGADRPAGFGAAGFDVRATRVGAREPEHVRAESRAELGVSRDRAEWPRPSAELQKAAELQSLNM